MVLLKNKKISKGKRNIIKREKNQIKQINKSGVEETERHLGNRKTMKYIQAMGNVSEDFQRMPEMNQNRKMKNDLGNNFRLRDEKTKAFSTEGMLTRNRGKNKIRMKGDLISRLFNGLGKMSSAVKNSVKGDKEKEYEVMKRDRLMKPREKEADGLTEKVMFMLKKLPKEEKNQDQEESVDKRIQVFKILNLIGVDFQNLYKDNSNIEKQKETLFKHLKT